MENEGGKLLDLKVSLGPLASGRTGGHRKARVTVFNRSSELFNPKHKTTRRTQNGIPFLMPPCCCLFPRRVYLTQFTARPEVPHTRCQHVLRSSSRAEQPSRDERPTSKSHQLIHNPITGCRPALVRSFITEIYARAALWKLSGSLSVNPPM